MAFHSTRFAYVCVCTQICESNFEGIASLRLACLRSPDIGSKGLQGTRPNPGWAVRTTATDPDLVYLDPDLVYTDPNLVYTDPDLVYSDPDLVYTDPDLVYWDPDLVYTDRNPESL